MRDLPELFASPVKARSLAYLYCAGAVMGSLTIALPHDRTVDELGLGLTACAAALVSALLFAVAERARMWLVHAAVIVGTVMVALANGFTGVSAVYPILFSWPILYAFYFLDRRTAVAHVALAAVAYAVVLILDDAPSPYVRWLLAIGTPVVAGVLISRLLDRMLAEKVESLARERLLEQSEARTRMVLDSAPDAFVAIDREGIVRTWNAAAERLFRWPASEAIGQPLRELIFPPSMRDAHDERRRTLLDPEGRDSTIVLQLELQRRDGSRFPAEARVSRVTVRGEVFAAGFVRDVSDRMRREAEREALVQEQAARAEAERVAELVSGMQLLVDTALAHRTRREILDDLVAAVPAVLGADSAAIYLTGADEMLTLAVASGGTPGGGDEAPLRFGEDFAGEVAAARRPMMADDRGGDSMIGVPLLAGDEVTGVLVVCAAGRPFGSDDLVLLRLAADRVALALEHAGLYERELRIAETLQRSLLPDRLPDTPGMEVSARYLPAADEAEVGGDWYDVLTIPGGGVGLVMGDIAGKGLGAATMVGRLRSALHAYALEGHSPAVIVGRLNHLVWSEGYTEGQMATLLFVVVDPAEACVRWVNAGHLPPLLVVGDGSPRFLEGPKSVPLGVLPFPDFQESSVTVEPDATVVLYTDGLVERPGESIDVGLERLVGLVQAVPDSADALCDRLLRSLVPAEAAADDVAVLALRTIPLSDRFVIELMPEPGALSAMRSLLRRWLRHAQASETELAEITMACGEAATNTIEHSGVGGATPFELTGRLEGRTVELSIRDRGAWRAPRNGDEARGLVLMRGLMDDVDVTTTSQGTTVRMSRTLR